MDENTYTHTYTHTPFSIIHWWNPMFDAWIALDLGFDMFWLVKSLILVGS